MKKLIVSAGLTMIIIGAYGVSPYFALFLAGVVVLDFSLAL